MAEPALDIDDPLQGGRLSALRHWGFVWDYDDPDGPGGFVSGEFLLRSDGVLLRRYGYSSHGKDGTRRQFQPWQVKDAGAGTTVGQVSRKLAGEGYGLYKPGPVPVDQRTGGPFPGPPALAEKATDLE